MIGSKRGRSALSPTRPEQPLLPEIPGTMWETEKPETEKPETEKPTVGPLKCYQNSNLAMEPDMGVQLQQENQAPNENSIWLSLPTSDPAERSLKTGFGEFLQACRGCRKKIDGKSDVYMYGYLGAFCKPECREALIKIDELVAERYSKSSKAVKGAEHAKER